MNKDVHKLLRIKRYEMPSSDYFERFLDEFHDRQRVDLISRPTLHIFFERLMSAFPDFQVPRLAYAGVAVAAVLFSATIISMQKEEAPTNSFALNSPAVDVLPVSQGEQRLPLSMRADLPPHYVLEARPVSYETPYSC